MSAKHLTSCIIASLATLGSVAPLMADVEVITAHRLSRGDHARVYVVTRPIVVPAATVSRELSEQPVRPHLVEVQLVNTTIFLDPDADYVNTGVNRIDENHSLIKAQRLARSLRAYANSVRVIHGMDAHEVINPHAIRPSMIMMKPRLGPAPAQPGDMPAVPQPPEKDLKTKSVAMAE